MNNVIVEYNDFSKEKSSVEKITFDLLPNISLSLSQETAETETSSDTENTETENTENVESEGVLAISMVDKQTDETEITGSLDKETLNALIRSLIIFRGQLS